MLPNPNSFGRKVLRPLSQTEIWVTSIASGAVVTLFRIVFFHLIAHKHHTVWFISSCAIIFFSVFGIVFYLRTAQSNARKGIAKRLKVLQVLNQEVRNALDIMANHLTAGTKEQYVVLKACDHIKWVIDEMMPNIAVDDVEVDALLKRIESKDKKAGD
jgi:hypothetical protein